MATLRDCPTPRIVLCLSLWAFTSVVGDVYSQGVQQEIKCENDTMIINCMVNSTIRTISAQYGQEFSGRHCVGDSDRRGGDACLSSRAQSTVVQRCQNKTSCVIPINRGTFNDRPCDSDISIYLHVRYVCVPFSAEPTPSSTVTRRQTPTLSARTQTPVFYDEAQTCRPCVGCVRCFRCRKRNITWPETPAGTWATAPCPNNLNLNESRLLCGTDPVDWVGRPDLSKCTSSKVGNIHEELKNRKDLNIQSLDSFASELVSYAETEKSLTGGDLIGISHAMYQVVQKFGLSVSNHTSEDIRPHVHHVSSAVVAMTNNLLDDDRTMSWADLPKAKWGSLASRMMSTVEATAFQMADTLTSGKRTVNVTKNILLEVSVIEADSSSPLEDFVFPNYEALKGSSWENTHNSFRLPVDSLARDRRLKVLFTSYNNMENLLLPNSSRNFCSDLDDSETCDAMINSRVISASINSNRKRGSETKLQYPVTFTLEHKRTENVSNPVCAFWKLSESDEEEEDGEWSDEGCSLEMSNSTHTTCSCNHLTSFAIIMSPTSPNISAANALALDVLTYIGCSISIICLFISFLTFACFRNLQCDRNTIHKNLVLCLFISNMIFLTGIDLVSLKILCSVVAGFLHYFLLTSFAWMCIEGVQLYYMLVEVFEADKSHVLWFYLSAYGVPAVVITVSASVYHEGYGTDRYCWLTTERGFIWAFIGPAAAVILVNCVMLGIALRAMYRHSVSAATWRIKEKTRIQQVRSWVKGSVVLIILLGLSWAFGLAYVTESTIAFAYIFTILNSLQGLFIFVFHCLLNEKVQMEYKRCVKKSEWLPERFRVWYTGPRGSSYASSRNQTNSSTVGRPWSRLLSRQRRNSQGTSVTRITSQRQSSLKKQESLRPEAAIPSDSGIEDPSSYLESAQIYLGESEFNAVGLSSALEGSIVDTNYSEKFNKQPQTGQLQGTPINKNLNPEEMKAKPLGTQSKSERRADSLYAPSVVDDPAKKSESNPVHFDQGLDKSHSEKPTRTKRKSTKKPTTDESFDAREKSPDSERLSVVNPMYVDVSGHQSSEHERNSLEHGSSANRSSNSVENYNRMAKSTGV